MPRARRRVRRVAPRHDRVRRTRTPSTLLQWLLTNDLRKIEPGRAQYTHLLDPDDAHVVDDIIVWWVDDERFFVMPNASNTDALLAAFAEGLAHTDGEVVFADVTADVARCSRCRAPRRGRCSRRCSPTRPRSRASQCGAVGELVVAGTGYTGEDGVELHVPAARRAGSLWTSSSTPGSTPAGPRRPRHACGSKPACRCTATSSGPGITPLQAGLGWVVGWDKDDFRGREPLGGGAGAG